MFCVCSLVFLVSQCLYDSESRTPEFHSSHPSSLAFGPPKCDVFHLVVTQSALCSGAGVTRCYSVTYWHDVPLPDHTVRSQHITTSTQVGLRAKCTLQRASDLPARPRSRMPAEAGCEKPFPRRPPAQPSTACSSGLGFCKPPARPTAPAL
jgi:hypothetical protein